MSGPSYVVRVAEDAADREACFAVRKEVFVGEQGVPEELEYDTYDADAVHVLAVREDGVPLGTGRLLRDGPSVGVLGRLAVTPKARGLGVGAVLVRAIEDAARARGLGAMELHAQTHAVGFYERLGYEAYGSEYLEAGIPHRGMRRVLG
ncbi:GNAT family N-acetyltransferase [Streptomyces sp. TRM68367]|uniref:GNAT family N-acetyltransferase n=1 Tax=Streptomyces sp. TRM68367 TaxID=2758415 RepID=UPI00165CB45E|nr:GNAT family N-acetyltransferase [Streptomyces sp. TRM68367]MBC9731252.1 GNAT family N-acetyltransferase [Streptomyces sp. TRM68367]